MSLFIKIGMYKFDNNNQLLNLPVVSIIIPFFNNQTDLLRCLDSLLRQTYTKWEAICVDDGSTDASGKIADDFAKSDARFNVIHQNNAGVSVARNVALSRATGTYLIMVDADDYAEPDMIEKMVERAESSFADFVITGTKCIRKGGKQINALPKMLPGLHASNVSDFFVHFSPAPHAKMYRMSIVKEHNISFPSGVVMGEDSVFNAAYWHYVKKVYVLKEALYVYDESNTLSATSKFVAGKLPFSVYAQTVALPCTIYDELSKRRGGVKTLSEWLPCLLTMQLIEHGWVMDAVGSDAIARAELKAISKNCYTRLAQKLTWYRRFLLISFYRIKWLKGRMMRFAGKVKRFVLGMFMCNK